MTPPQTPVPWVRYWAPVGATVCIVDGFLLEPSAASWAASNNPCRSLSDLDALPCVVLLGEPGSGKSSTLQAEKQRIASHSRIHLIDLKEVGSDIDLKTRLSTCLGSSAPKPDEGSTFLLLDSVDECQLTPSVLAGLLSAAIATTHGDHLRLRVVCRTAEWRPTLETTLRTLWPDEQCAIYELLPLTHDDVVLAARLRFGDAAPFMASVHARQAGFFASKAITLSFLLRLFARDGDLPEGKSRLYEQGCLVLADELSDSRRDARNKGDLTPAQRMLLAGRIAAYSRFCARSGVWLGPPHEAPDSCLTIREIAHGAEHVNGHSFAASETAVEEVLRTSLFSSRGQRIIGFAHQAYEEFLAAKYLQHRRVPIQQLSDLLFSTADDGSAIVPQLIETAAWLASWLPDFRQRTLRADPLVLLRSDIATLGAPDRHELVAELLEAFRNESITDHDWALHGLYRQLVHPQLHEQLEPVMRCKSVSVIARRFAIDTAEACKVTTLQGAFVALALDATDDVRIRKEAAYALIAIGDAAHRHRLKPLLSTTPDEDPDDELHGCALGALWPDCLTTDQVLAHIRPPRNPSLAGSYSVFLHSFPRRITATDLPHVLDWASVLIAQDGASHSLEALVDDLLIAAAPMAADPLVLAPIASLVRIRHSRHETILYYRHKATTSLMFVADDEIRRTLILTLLEHVGDNESEVTGLAFSPDTLMRPSDLEWLSTETAAEPNEPRRRKLAHLFLATFQFHRGSRDWVQVFDLVMEAAERVPEVRSAFAHLLEPVGLNSELAGSLRQQLQQEEELRKRTQRTAIVPSPHAHVLAELGKCEAGDVGAWMPLYLWMFCDPDGRNHERKQLEAQVVDSPVWQNLDDCVRRRLREAGRRYIEHHVPDSDRWKMGSVVVWADAAGYGALVLLAESGDLDRGPFPSAVWQRWAPVIYAYPRSSGAPSASPHVRLCHAAYQNAPDEVLDTVFGLALREDGQHHRLFVLQRLPDPRDWDGRLQARMLGFVRSQLLSPGSCATILKALTVSGSRDAVDFAHSLVTTPRSTDETERKRAEAVAAVLLFHDPNTSWKSIWAAFHADPEFGKSVMLMIAHDVEYRLEQLPLAAALTEQQAAQLFVWMEREFPQAQDPDHSRDEDAHFVGPLESVGELRNSLLRRVVRGGTPASVSAVAWIQAQCPHLPWLKWQRLEAERETRIRSWHPLAPTELATFLESPDQRVVSTDDQLFDLLVGALDHLQERLRHDASLARGFWEQQASSRVFRPVTEGRFRDLIAAHLTQVLRNHSIIVNREVEVRASSTGHLGERADIRVDAIRRTDSTSGPARLSVLIECKGCWNPGVETDVTEQLHGRYLKTTDCTHGIYLVGWFSSANWDDHDHRCRRCTDTQSVASTLRETAANLSRDGYRVGITVLENVLT